MKSKSIKIISVLFLLIFSVYNKVLALDFGDPVDTNFKYYSRTLQPKPDPHNGLDIVGKSAGLIKGQNAYASVGGEVIKVYDKIESTTYGKAVVIKHSDGYETVYAHLESINGKITEGVRVDKGQELGKIDSTGRSTGHHLHFEIRKNGTFLNPLNSLTGYKPQSGATGGSGIAGVGSAFGPGGGHPDETFSVADSNFAAINLDDTYYRLAVKKNKINVINYYKFLKLVEERIHILKIFQIIQ